MPRRKISHPVQRTVNSIAPDEAAPEVVQETSGRAAVSLSDDAISDDDLPGASTSRPSGNSSSQEDRRDVDYTGKSPKQKAKSKPVPPKKKSTATREGDDLPGPSTSRASGNPSSRDDANDMHSTGKSPKGKVKRKPVSPKASTSRPDGNPSSQNKDNDVEYTGKSPKRKAKRKPSISRKRSKATDEEAPARPPRPPRPEKVKDPRSLQVYRPGGVYTDLGYVGKSLEGAFGIAEGSWSTLVMSFNFNIGPEQLSSEASEALRSREYLRLVRSNLTGNSMILVPEEGKRALPIQGDVVFPQLDDAARPPHLSHLTSESDEAAVLEAIRRFASVAGLKKGLRPIDLVPLPDKNDFDLEGAPWLFKPVIRARETLTSDQELFFVMGDCSSDKIKIDVYLTEAFFEAPSHSETDEGEDAHKIRNSQRMRLLLSLGREIIVKENPLLDNLAEKKYVIKADEEKRHVFGDHTDPEVLEQMYAFVKESHADQLVSAHPDPQHSSLLLKMHEYQKRAVSWMLSKEFRAEKDIRVPHPLYFPFETVGGAQLYMHTATGRISRALPTVKSNSGGILADEMGLGKTLESISLVLSHPSPREEPDLPRGVLKNVFPVEPNSVVQCYCYENKSAKPVKTRSPSKRGPRGKTSRRAKKRVLDSDDDDEIGSTEEDEKPFDEISCVKCGTTFHRDCCGGDFLPAANKFLCGICNQTDKIKCKTTLVVAPAAILSQWCMEIEKSTRDLSYCVYRGISAVGFVSPWELAQYDLVLASYEMLTQELLYVNAAEKKQTLRKASTRKIIPSPLLALRFWRFILDEAQMVESQTANYTRMALLVYANFYWAVTGTPIQRGVRELRSLFGFVEISPWHMHRWFNECIVGPFKANIPGPLYDIVGECMWRLQKKDVENEMDLPPCKTLTHKIAFSGIEMQVYQQVYQDCIKMLGSKIGARLAGEDGGSILDKKFSELDGDLVRVIKTWMGHLEKLCSSPTRVKYFFREGQKVKRMEKEEGDTTDSLKRCLAVLLFKAKSALQNSVRTAIFNRNGAAGYLWLAAEFPEAADQYRSAKRAWTTHEQYVDVDHGQKLHILMNLAVLIEQHRDVIPRTLEDETLGEQAKVLNDELDLKCRGNRTGCIQKIEKVWTNVPHRPKDFSRAFAAIFSVIGVVRPSDEADFISQCKLGNLSAPGRFFVHSRALQGCYESSVGLRVVLNDRWKLIMDERDKIQTRMDSLVAISADDEEFMNVCADCHLRNEISLKKCEFCKIEKVFREYEELIFRALVAGDDDSKGFGYHARRQKLRIDADDDAERILMEHDGDFGMVCKAIVTYVRRKYKPEYDEIDKEVKLFITCLDTLKKEYKAWTELWRTLGNMAAMRDETRQALIRVRFATPEEMAVAASIEHDNKGKNGKAKAQQWLDYRALVKPGMHLRDKIGYHLNKAAQADVTVQREVTHFKYMRNMHESYVREDEMEENDCVICQEKVAKIWAVFPCGHIMCRVCVKFLRDNQADKSRVVCPVCRAVTNNHDIVTADTFRSTMNTGPANTISHNSSNLQLRGAPLKMEAVVRAVFDLNIEEPDAKILIFSEYPDVLEDYAEILKRNGVKALHVKTKAHIPLSIEKLRDNTAKILLMPIALGGKGLTIIEATHVFFLEPLLNKGAELQAIGRIHRMGQTKPTFVHKFIVDNTIDEVLHNMAMTVGQEGNLLQESLTLRQVLQLLKSSGHRGSFAEDDAIWNLNPGAPVDDNAPSTSQGQSTGLI